MSELNDAVREAMLELHRRKDSVYGNAWKRRGEVFGIIPNIARKIDRIEAVALRDCDTVDGETLLDTIVDLILYCLKYKTFLADLDEDIASQVFGQSLLVRPYSDGTSAVETICRDLTMVTTEPKGSSSEASADVLSAFGDLERCFNTDNFTIASPAVRLRAVDKLIRSAVALLCIVMDERTDDVKAFITSNPLPRANQERVN